MAVLSKPNIVLQPHEVIRRPVVTEKATRISEKYNVYSFEVNPQASKGDIKGAIETLFKVRVVRVRTQNYVGKPRRTKMIQSYTKPWKKAIVELHEDDRITLF
jgi:large subunit ribosomal protein L23